MKNRNYWWKMVELPLFLVVFGAFILLVVVSPVLFLSIPLFIFAHLTQLKRK